eukprot:5377447-Karenia_brevis.AAC.1
MSFMHASTLKLLPSWSKSYGFLSCKLAEDARFCELVSFKRWASELYKLTPFTQSSTDVLCCDRLPFKKAPT